MKNIISFIHTQLEKHTPVILMTVVDRQGSSPGKTGFKMAVSADGSFTGSIGGGTMEYRLVEKSKRLFGKKQVLKPFLMLQDHDPEAKENRSGMICSGGQTIAFTPLNDKHSKVVADIYHAVEEHQKGVLELSEKGLLFNEGLVLDQRIELNILSESKWTYREQVGMPDSLYIFGGGHVGLALSKLFSLLDFHVSIFDNRADINTIAENHYAQHKEIVDYSNISGLVPEGHNVYVVVMTFAHKSDEQVLKQMLGKNLRYLGMMGSGMKVATIFGHLLNEGITQQELDKVYAPIGLAINSESPAEIAISIAAQVIAVKNGATKTKG